MCIYIMYCMHIYIYNYATYRDRNLGTVLPIFSSRADFVRHSWR